MGKTNKDIFVKLGICSIILLGWGLIFSSSINALIPLDFQPRIPPGDISSPLDLPEPPSLKFPATIYSAQPPEIGESYTQTVYNRETQSLIQNVWEYRPGLAMYGLSQGINLGLITLNEISQDGWILKGHRSIENVKDVEYGSNGNIVAYTIDNDTDTQRIEFSDDIAWDKTYSFIYAQTQNKQEEWEINLDVVIEGKAIVSETLERQREADVGNINDVNQLIDIMRYEPDKDKRSQILARIAEVGNENDVKLAENIEALFYARDYEDMRRAAINLLRLKDNRAVEPIVAVLLHRRFAYAYYRYRYETLLAVAWNIDEGKTEDVLIARLNEPSARFIAIESLGLIHSSRAVIPLTEILLSDENSYMRREAALALGKIKDERAVEALGQAMFNDSDQAVKNCAARALAEIKTSRAKDILIEGISSGNDAIIQAVNSAISGDPELVTAIVSAEQVDMIGYRLLNGGGWSEVRILENIGTSKAVEYLCQALLNHTDNFVKGEAAEALGNIGNESAVDALGEALLNDEFWGVRDEATRALGKIGGPKAVAYLKEALLKLRYEPEAAKALYKIGTPEAKQALFEVLSQAYQTDNNIILQAVIPSIGDARVPESVDILIAVLQDQAKYGPLVRKFAAEALGKIGNPKAVTVLGNALLEDDFVDNAAAIALGEIGAVEGIEYLEQALLTKTDGSNYMLREYVAAALGRIKDPRSAQILSKALLTEKVLTVKEAIAEALGKLKNPIGVDALIQTLMNTAVVVGKGLFPTREEAFRWAVEDALISIGAPAAEGLIHALKTADSSHKERITEILWKIGFPALDSLIQNLGDTGVRDELIQVIKKIGERVVMPLIECLMTNEDENLKAGAVKALIEIGNPVFIPAVQMLLDSDDVRLQNYGIEILQGLATITGEGIDPQVSLAGMKSLSTEQLVDIVLRNTASLTRAAGWHYLKLKMDAASLENLLRGYIFSEEDGRLYLQDRDISKLEMASILNTGIPAQSDWWGRLANKDERIKYLSLVLKGDFTDERPYILFERKWVCVQYATQLVINFNGWDDEHFADLDVFTEYGAGYTVSSVVGGYGIPMYYTGTKGLTSGAIIQRVGHAVTAVFVGEDFSDETQRQDIANWIFVEPQNDSFSPNFLGEEVDIYLDLLFLPDGEFGGNYSEGDKITVKTEGYPYKRQ